MPGNQRGTVGEMDREVVAIFKKWGFAWGGDWNYTDPMHFEMDASSGPAEGSTTRAWLASAACAHSRSPRSTVPPSVSVAEVPEPTPGDRDVARRGARPSASSWPDLLQTRGEYQLKPELPFQLGVDFAGDGALGARRLRASPPATGSPASCRTAVARELVAVDPDAVFPLPDARDRSRQAAALPMNYLTAEFALATRAGLRRGETVLVHGAAGGVGTASIQVAKGLRRHASSRWSRPRRRRDVARAAGADEAVLVDGFRAAVKELTGGRGRRRRDRRRRRRPDDRLAALAGPARAGCWSSGSPAAASPR